MPLETRLLEDALGSKGAVGWNKKTKRGGSALTTCCCAICCPCMTYGATLKRLPSQKFMCGGSYLGACLTYTICFWSTSGLGAGCLECCLRKGVADLKDEDEGFCCSCIYAFCCAPCSATQMYKEANLRAAEEEGGDQTTTAAPAPQTFGSLTNRKPAERGAQCIVPQKDGSRGSTIATWVDTDNLDV